MKSANHPSPPVLCLAGPTAVGKSEVALVLAGQYGGEIVSVDSMQVYRGLEIGTAKPTAAERQRVTHHLLDVVSLSDGFDAAQFVRLARRAVADIRQRGHWPILCGGTGFYFRAFLEGLGEAPPADYELRRELEQTPLSELTRELRERDPVAFERTDLSNPRRVVRAVEILRLTRRPLAEQRAAWRRGGHLPDEVVLVGLKRPPAELRRRIEQRVERMFALGLVEETRRLLEQGLAENRTALQALGYRQVIEHLQGKLTLAEAIGQVKQRTWQFARRQMTWFRHQLPVRWVEVSAIETAAVTAEGVARAAGIHR